MSKALGMLALVLFAGLLLGGCSGGGGNSAAPQSIDGARAVITLKWPDAGRLIPLQTARIDVTISDAEGFSVTKTATRPPAGETETTLIFEALPLSMLTINIIAFPDTEGLGTPLATGERVYDAAANPNFNISVQLDSTVDHLTVTPANPVLDLGQNDVQLAATAFDEDGNQVLLSAEKLQWASADGTVVGVSSTGLLQALKSTSDGVTVTVTDLESTKSASTLVKVNTVVVSAITPTITVNPGASQDLAELISVTGAVNKSVTWSVGSEEPGSLSGSVYTAPTTHGTYHVTATSVADPSKSATITIDAPILLSVNPPSVTTTLSHSVNVTAAVTGASNNVTWHLSSESKGTLTSTSATMCTYKAPKVATTDTLIINTVDAHNGEVVSKEVTIVVESSTGAIVIF